jgi:hypothetical protein
MRAASLLAATIAVTMMSAAGASAQRIADDPPGWAFQRRGIIEMNGGNPLRYGHGRYRGASAYAWSRGHRHYRHRR